MAFVGFSSGNSSFVFQEYSLNNKSWLTWAHALWCYLLPTQSLIIIKIIIIASNLHLVGGIQLARSSKTSTKMQMSFFRLGNYGAVEAETLTEITWWLDYKWESSVINLPCSCCLLQREDTVQIVVVLSGSHCAEKSRFRFCYNSKLLQERAADLEACIYCYATSESNSVHRNWRLSEIQPSWDWRSSSTFSYRPSSVKTHHVIQFLWPKDVCHQGNLPIP